MAEIRQSPSSSDEEIATHKQPVGREFESVETAHGAFEDPDVGLSEEERRVAEKKLLRKLDLRLIPWLSFLYLVSFLDRTNIGNAKVAGNGNAREGNFAKDLHNITDGQYSLALSLFFVSYALFEPLTNILLKRFSPRYFLTGTMILWGIVMTTMGLVHDYQGLTAARFFLGVAEAGLFPGINYYLSCWYKRSEFGIRAAIFFSAAALAGSFGGLLAAAIAQMNGVGGKPGWAWIFILEGLATIVIGACCLFMVHDFPDSAKFLTNEERARVVKRLREDKQASANHEKFQMRFLWEALRDWKTYAFALVYMGADMPLYAFSLFVPTIIKGLGYTGTNANLLSVPPYACAAVLTVIVGFAADRTKQRGIFNIATSLLGIAGFCMLIGSHSFAVNYAGVFLAALGIYPCIANTIAWCSNNIEGVYKRGVVLGIAIGWGNLNGVVSSNIYRHKTNGKYYEGHGIILAYLFIFLLCGSLITRTLLARENKKRRSGLRDNWYTEKSELELENRGDRRPDFIYTL